jgi:hypothetical protein
VIGFALDLCFVVEILDKQQAISSAHGTKIKIKIVHGPNPGRLIRLEQQSHLL